MKDEKEWLVSDATCKGCQYYGWLSASAQIRACMYTCYTGKIRTDKPKDCTVKRRGKLLYEDELRKTRKRPKKRTV